MKIPVKFVGNSVGVRSGGKLIAKAQKLRVLALPSKLPDVIEIKIDDLDIGQSIKVAQITSPDYSILDSPNNPIVTIKTTRASQSAAAATDSKKK